METQTNVVGRLARFSARRRWYVIAAWVGILAVSLMLAGTIGDSFGKNTIGPVTEADKAQDLIDKNFNGGNEVPQEWVVVESESLRASDQAFEDFVSALQAEISSAETVTDAVSYVDGAPGMVTEDGRAAIIHVTLLNDEDHAAENAGPVVDAVNAANVDSRFQVTVAGSGSIDAEFTQLANDTMAKGELIGVVVALVILFVVFGAAVAAGLPILLAVAGILVAVAASAVAGRVLPLDEFVVEIITMIGLAVGIDYSLFIVKRYREELAKGYSRLDAITNAGETSAKTVVVSGASVVIALSGMLIMPNSTFRSFGMGAVFVVIAAVIAALTLLPAAISILGNKLDWVRLPRIRGRKQAEDSAGTVSQSNGFWDRTTRLVMNHPVASVVATSGALIAAAAFTMSINLGSNGLESLPDDSGGLHAFHVLTEEFGAGLVTASVVVDRNGADAAEVESSVEALVGLIDGDSFFGDTNVATDPTGEVTLVDAVILGDFTSDQAKSAIGRVRGKYLPSTVAATGANVYVGGGTASVMDEVDLTTTYLPYVFGFVLGSSFLLLMVVFRSVVVPAKAVLMNLLSVGAAYGLLVLVFQEGLGADLFGFKQVPVIEFWLPLFLFSILFGLSMDYHVFMLSRIKEHYDETGDNRSSVAFGLRSTAGIITGAALIMVAVFGGFALGGLSMFQQMGFGLAAAVIIDVTLIRSVLVPATMELLGDWNWYFPTWLEWLPKLNVEGRSAPSAQVQAAAISGAAE